MKRCSNPKSLLRVIFLCFFLFSQVNISNAQIWQEVNESRIEVKSSRVIVPSDYKTFNLDVDAMKSILNSAPAERSSYQIDDAIFIELPLPDGSFLRIAVEESPIWEDGYGEKFPDMMTYVGYAVQEPGTYVRFDMTIQGFHAMIMRAGKSTVFIDPYTHNTSDKDHYIVYDRAHFTTTKVFTCGVSDISDAPKDFVAPQNRVPYTNCELKEYRLALAATGEYTAFHGGTVAGAAAAQVTSMNRVNGVYIRDFGIKMNIVTNNNLIIYTNGSTDPYTNGNGGTMLGQNQSNCDAVIGSANYDIGHVFSTGGGGVAYLQSPCTSIKAGGVTGSGAPVGDPFDIDYVAHEMGHQFGGNHTQNNSCNRSSASVECGSGSSIMGYAGICAPNVQNNSNDHFNGWNQVEIGNFISNASTGGSCATITTVSNNNPTISGMPSSHVLPVSTPFALTATAVDTDPGNSLTYCWEQQDPAVATQPPVSTNTGGPTFRSLSPSSSPTRYLPNLPNLTAGISPTWEVLPGVSRNMNWKLTVRDNDPVAGCPEYQNLSISFNALAGPFVVNYPTSTGVSWTAFTSQTVTWNVANSNLAPVSCAIVDIVLSTDGGLTYPTVILAGTANDGTQSITVPNVNTSTARIMVRAADNIFFDISNNNFTIIPGAADDFTLSVTSSSASVCKPADATYAIQVNQLGSFTDPVTLSVAGLPAGANSAFSINPVTPPGASTLTISNTAAVTAGTYPFTVTGTSTTSPKTLNLTLIVSETPAGPVTLISPADAAVSVAMPTNFSWTSLGGTGQSYSIDIATDAAFVTIVDNATGLSSNSYTSVGLVGNTQYFWRVSGLNDCGTVGNSGIFSFTTSSCILSASTDVPKSISASGTSTITSTITIATAGTVLDLDVRNLIGTHSYMADLSFTLTSPLGTVRTLFAGICTSQDNFDLELDDAATAGAIPCPPTTGLEYQPTQSLAAFNGESVTGTWTLTIVDGADGDGGSLNSWSLDICLGAPVTCFQPSAMTVSNITAVGADLGWTENGTATLWNIDIGASPFTPDQNPEHSGVSNAYTWIAGLASTTYEYYVQADCGAIDGTSNWTGPFSFTTLSAPPPPITGVSCGAGNQPSYIFTEEFDAIGGWTGNISAATNGTWEIPGNAQSTGTGPSAAYSGANYANFESSGPSSATANMVSPAIDLTAALDDVELSFYFYAYGADIGTLRVGVGTSAAGPFTNLFTSIGEIQTGPTESWTPVGLDLTSYIGQTVYIRFQQEATGTGFTGDLSVDFVRVQVCEDIPGCPSPSAGLASNVTTTTASLNWTEGGTATEWAIEWGADGFTQGTGFVIAPTSANPYSLSGLTENTDYDFYVRAICAVGDSSTWSGPFSFSTLIGSNTPCVGGFAGVYPCDNYDLQGHLTLAEMGASGGVEGNDIWGWTDPLDDKEYAIFGMTNGTAFVDVSDPLNPRYLGKLPTHSSSNIWRDMKVYNNYAFIVADNVGSHGMQVFDLTLLRNVVTPQTFTNTAHYSGVGSAHNIVINEATGFAYIVGSNQNSGGLHFVNIQNPLAPVVAGGFSADGYTHDAQVVVYNGPDVTYQGLEIAFASNEDTFTIVDVDDKLDPQQISRTGYAGSSYAHQGWVTEDHQFFLMNDEFDEQNYAHNTRTYIWNIVDLDIPVFLGYFESSIAAIDHNNYVKGDSLYQANYRGGLRVLDISDVANANLTEVGFFDVYPASNSAQFNGAWSNYPYFASGNIIISSIEDGLFIVKASPVPPCSVDAVTNGGNQTACNPSTDTYSNDVTVTFTNAPASGNLVVNGQTFAIGTSPQTVTLVGLVADGNAVNVTASFSADAGCTATVNSLFTAPVSCAIVGCSPDVTAPVMEGQCGTESANLGSYNDGWQTGDGNTAIFGTWSLATSNGNPSQAGHFIGSSNIDLAGESWGMYANSGQLSEASLSIDNALFQGSSISLAMDNGSINSGGTVGIGLRNASGQNLWEFFFVGGGSGYTINDASGANATGMSFTDQGLTIELYQSSATTLDYVITKLSDSSTITGTSTMMTPGSGAQAISQARFFNFDAGGLGANDAYFNSLQVCYPCPATVTVSCADVLNTGITGLPVVTDYCDGSPTLAFSDLAGACSAGSFNVVRTFIATDVSSNSSSCAQNITVTDNLVPTAVCQNVTVNLDGSGNGALAASQVDNGSSDGCSSVTLAIDRTSFTCADVPLSPITVTLTVTDECGNSSTCTSQVTVVTSPACGGGLVNDNCAGAISLTPSLFGYPLWDTLSVAGATQTLAACIGDADDDTWYSWVAQSANDIVITQDVGGTSDMVIEIFDGCAGTSLGCFDNYGLGELERAWVGGLMVGNTYYFRTYDKGTGGPTSGQVRVLVKTFAIGGIRDIYCGITNYQSSSWFTPERQDFNQLYPYTTVAAAGYEVKLTDQSTSSSYVKTKVGNQSQFFQFNDFAGIPFNALFDAQARHALIVNVNGTTMTLWSEYGSACTMGLGGVTESNIRTQYCQGINDFGLQDQLLAVYVPNATAYRFTFFDGILTHTRTKTSYGLLLSDVPGLEYGKTYQVTVEVQVNGTWSTPGDVCSINMLSQPPATFVRAQFCNGTYLFPNSNYILADQVYGADQYQWRFTPTLGGQALTQMTGTLSLAFHLTNMPLQSGATYDVAVRARVQGLWGDYAASCPLTIQANPTVNSGHVSASKLIAGDEGHFSLFPNPNSGEEVRLNFKSASWLEGMANIEVLDILGKLIQTEQVAVKGEEMNYTLRFDEELHTGMYLIRVTRDEITVIQRLSVE